MSTEEINKLIAGFEGSMIIHKYHADWNTLMRVIQKIEKTNVNIGNRGSYKPAGTSIVISLYPPMEVHMWNETGWSYKGSGNILIDEVYKAVAGFIEFYQLKQQNKQ